MKRLFYGRENNKWPWWLQRAEFPVLPEKAQGMINRNITDANDALFAREQVWAIVDKLA